MNNLICKRCELHTGSRQTFGPNEVCEHLRPAVSALIEGVFPGGVSDGQTWVLVLSKYHRDNLLHLLNAIGYPWGWDYEERTNVPNPYFDPTLARYNTGDWAGEIPIMLSKPGGPYAMLAEDDKPNSVQPAPVSVDAQR